MSEETRKIPVEVYSRIVGYFRPVRQWNLGKAEEKRERLDLSAKSLSGLMEARFEIDKKNK